MLFLVSLKDLQDFIDVDLMSDIECHEILVIADSLYLILYSQIQNLRWQERAKIQT